MKQELKKVFIDIMEYQMNYVQLARTTEPYKLAERGLKLLEESEVKKLSKADVISSVCDHPFNSLDIDKKLLHHFCNKCGKYVYKQTDL